MNPTLLSLWLASKCITEVKQQVIGQSGYVTFVTPHPHRCAVPSSRCCSPTRPSIGQGTSPLPLFCSLSLICWSSSPQTSSASLGSLVSSTVLLTQSKTHTVLQHDTGTQPPFLFTVWARLEIHTTENTVLLAFDINTNNNLNFWL